MIKYASAILAFAAALTGIIGDTHDAAHPGIKGITALGWIAIIAAMLSFIVLIIETYRDHVTIGWQAQQKAKVQDIANRQVVEAVFYLLNPFRIFLSQEIWSKRQELEIDLERLDDSASYIVDLLCNPTVQNDFKGVDLRAKPNVAPPITWWEYLANCAVKARDLLNEAAAKYSGYLSPDSLVAIEELRADGVVAFRLPNLGELVTANMHISPFPLSNAFGIRDDYLEFNAMLQKLRNVLVHVDLASRPLKK
jgi:hypothetical protein